jgi:predicted enzyme related to lactoylglutathione lyase
MGNPVVHFEVIGKDAEKLQSYYSELFGWVIDGANPLNYGTVAIRMPTAPESGAGSQRGQAPTTRATSPSTSKCRTSRPRSPRR